MTNFLIIRLVMGNLAPLKIFLRNSGITLTNAEVLVLVLSVCYILGLYTLFSPFFEIWGHK